MSTYDQRYVLRKVTQEEALVRIFSNQSPEKRVLQFRTREYVVYLDLDIRDPLNRLPKFTYGPWSQWQDVREEEE